MIDSRKATSIVGSIVTIGSSLLLGCAGAFSVWVGLTFTSSWLPVVWGLVMLIVALVLIRKRP